MFLPGRYYLLQQMPKQSEYSDETSTNSVRFDYSGKVKSGVAYAADAPKRLALRSSGFLRRLRRGIEAYQPRDKNRYEHDPAHGFEDGKRAGLC